METLRLRLPLLLLVFLIPFAIARMQEDAPMPLIEITGVNPTQLPVATINVNVVDAFGRPVGGLIEENFTLSGDLAEVAQIVSVENVTDDNLAFAVVLVIDVSSSMSGTPFDRAKQAAAEFVNDLGANDPIAIIAFSDSVQLVQDYTTDKTLLLNAIETLPLGGQTDLYGGAAAGIQKARTSPTPRRAVILLSDGAQYLEGRAPAATRQEGLTEASTNGVPVYTIGLGFGTDRTYLQALAEVTNAQFDETPNPERLLGIYNDLAALLRSQYVITLDAPLPLDGTEYDFALQAETPGGTTNEATGTLRAPIPVPLVSIEPQPEEPLTELTMFTVTTRTDEIIVGQNALIVPVDKSSPGIGMMRTSTLPPEDAEPATDTLTYTQEVDPFITAPGDYTFTFSATDETGDVGTDEVEFTVAALPAVLTLSPQLSELGTISAPTTITLGVEEQTPTTGVTVSVDGETVTELNAAPFTFEIDPAVFTPGDHTLTVETTSESGAVGTSEDTFTVAALPPTLTITGLEAGEVLTEARTIAVEVGGQTPAESVVVSVDGEEIARLTEAPFTVDLEPLDFAPNTTLTFQIDVVNTGGEANSVSIPFSFDLAPFLTATPPTSTPTATFTATRTATFTRTPTDTLDFAATDDAATQVAQTTLNAQATSDKQSTAGAATANAVATATQSAADLEATADAQATQQANTATAQASLDSAATSVQASANRQATRTAQRTATTGAQVQSTQTAQIESDNTATNDAQSTLDVEATIAQVAATGRADAATETAAAPRTATAVAQGRAAATASAEPTDEPTATLTLTDEPTSTTPPTDEPTSTLTPTDEPTSTIIPTDEPTLSPTEEATVTSTPSDEATITTAPTEVAQVNPSATPRELTEIVDDSNPQPDQTLPLLAICGGLILLALIVLFLVTRRRTPRQS